MATLAVHWCGRRAGKSRALSTWQQGLHLRGGAALQEAAPGTRRDVGTTPCWLPLPCRRTAWPPAAARPEPKRLPRVLPPNSCCDPCGERKNGPWGMGLWVNTKAENPGRGQLALLDKGQGNGEGPGTLHWQGGKGSCCPTCVLYGSQRGGPRSTQGGTNVGTTVHTEGQP